jgi:hypothetical protein
VQDIAKKSDKVFALDPGQTIGQKVKGNQNIYRSAGDVVSLASAGSKNIKTLTKSTRQDNHPALIKGNPTQIGIAAAIDAYHAHDIENIKDSDIFV